MYLASPTRIASITSHPLAFPEETKMARSLTIKHEEGNTTSPLLTGFLLFAAAWLLLTAVSGYAGDISGAPVPDAMAPIVAE